MARPHRRRTRPDERTSPADPMASSVRPPVISGAATGSAGGYQVHERPTPVLVPFDVAIPDDLLEGLPFAALDDGLPLLLLPVRIETRYRLAHPAQLLIRIYPDQVHVRIAADPVTGARLPAEPVLLPRQWLAIGYRAGAAVFQQASRPVARGLRTGPDPAAASWDVAGTGLVVDDAMAWMLDYDRAVEAGMAITVPLTGPAAAAADGLDVLLVLGVDSSTDPQDAAVELGGLLRAHASTTGLGFVAQGTATNNTAGVAAGSAPAGPGVAAGARAAPVDDLPGGGPLTPTLQDNGSRFARALGLGTADSWRDLPLGTDTEYLRSRWMRSAMFEAVLGTYLRELLLVGGLDGLDPPAVAAVRGWFVDNVTGGAPVPCVRVGNQPYGILPVRRSTPQPDPDRTAGVAGQVERVIGLLVDEWRRAAAGLPVLDPGAADAAGDPAVETTIATILATQPHPARLFLRPLEQFSTLLANERLGTTQALYGLILAAVQQPASPWTDIALMLLSHSLGGDMRTVDGQIDAWTDIRERLPGVLRAKGAAGSIDDGLLWIDWALRLLDGYEERQRPLRWIGLSRYEGALGAQNTQLVEALMHESATEWGPLGVVEAPEPPAGQTAARYLADLRERFLARDGTLPPAGIDLDPQPLLHQLLDSTLHLVPEEAAVSAEVAGALSGLAGLDAGTLDWLLRETLGLGTHRLDAWATSLAGERLGRLRQARPDGIQVGAFGWVRDLVPREPGALSGSYLLTPSLAHATTAAVLRSGWQAHGDDDPASPTAVDARSHRVRAASWLLDGVRTGQSLADLLGYRFERTLHDLGADEDIRTVRQQVLTAAERPDVAPDQPVDGIQLLELHRGGLLPTGSKAVRTALSGLDETFDAVNDVTVLEAVHQLTTGNHERAGAVLDAVSLGTLAPPELRSPLTPLTGPAIEHRVVVLLDPDPPVEPRGWAAGGRAAVAPAVEAWVASLLPPAGAVGVTGAAVFADGTRRPCRLTLADLGLSALDAIHLVGDDPGRPTDALNALAALTVDPAATAELDPDDAGAGELSLSEFWLPAVELRRGIESWRVLDSRELLAAAAAGDPVCDATAPMAAAAALLADVSDQLDGLDRALGSGDRQALVGAVAAMARNGIAAGGAPADPAAGARLRTLVARRLANVRAVEEPPEDARAGLERRLAVLLATRVPLLGSFDRPAPGDEGAVRLGGRLADPELLDAWLDAVGRVRPDVGRLTTAGMLSVLLTAGEGLRAEAGQVPAADGEQWAAVAAPPAGTGGRLCLVAIVGPGGLPGAGGPVCGLAVDRWVERIPAEQHVAGLAVQYDAPSNRPPQSWLLAVPPDGEPWSLSLVTATLLETLEWATLRNVGPEDLLDYGRAVPTALVPRWLSPWPDGSRDVTGSPAGTAVLT